MKILLFLSFLFSFNWANSKEKASQKDSMPSQNKESSLHTDQSLKKKKTSKEKDQASSPNVISQKIKKIFSDFITLLEKEPLHSTDYTKAVQFLENSLYNQASFESLTLLSEAYKEKKDFQNQIKVLNILVTNYSKKAKAFYLLGEAYKNLYFNQEENKTENRERSIENFHQALKLNKKSVLAYKALLTLLKEKDEKTNQYIHTKESLSVVIDMLKNLKKAKDYILLCKAYYDTQFFKQSRAACKRSIKENPKDAVSPLILALNLEKNKDILKVAKNFKKSFFVQYNTALYFMKKNPSIAISYLNKAYNLKPDNLTLNSIMSKFLFKNNNEAQSYKHFLKVCKMTKGQSLRDFRQATSRLKSRKTIDIDLVSKFQKGTKLCFKEVKKLQRKKKS